MADEIKKTLRIHQALHGYADGHRLLASSTSLKARDQKTMLVMSDVSGAGASLSEGGYLTGYPLMDSGLYAVGRTWAATEMSRPGCVWTHTLLLDFADLASLASMSFLDDHFSRPSGSLSEGAYARALSVPKALGRERRSRHRTLELERIICALYDKPHEKIVADLSPASEDLVFLIWAQQWPRLRRSFRFCTSSFSDRSTEVANFDLQFSPISDRSYRTRFSDVIDVTKAPAITAAWLEDAINDIEAGNGELREFFKHVGGDIPGGREMFVPLCSLHSMIPGFGLNGNSIADAIALVNSMFEPSSATTLRALIVSAVAQHFESLDLQSATFLLKHLELLGSREPAKGLGRLGEKLWALVPDQLLSLTDIATVQGRCAESIIKAQKADDLISAGKQHPGLMFKLIALRPDILEISAVWSVGGDWAQDALMASDVEADQLLRSLVHAERIDLCGKAIEKYGTAKVLGHVSDELLETQGRARSPLLFEWLDRCARDIDAIARTFTFATHIHIRLLVELAYRTQPDQVPNAVGEDPWATAINKCSGTIDEPSHQYLCAYLLARVFGYRSHSQAEISIYSFDEIYFAALHGRLPDNCWQLVDRALPRSWWFEWDRCQRLRDALTDMFVDRDLPVKGFAGVTKDLRLFEELARLAARNSRGRKYLKKVIKWLEESGDGKRRKMLEDIL